MRKQEVYIILIKKSKKCVDIQQSLCYNLRAIKNNIRR